VLTLNTLHKYFVLLFKVSYFICGVCGWLFGYEMAGFVFGDNLFSTRWYGASLLAGSMWFMPFFSTYGVSFGRLWGWLYSNKSLCCWFNGVFWWSGFVLNSF
jgi:hypothetical protein